MRIFNFLKKEKNKNIKTGNAFLDSASIPYELKQEIKEKLPNYIPTFYDNSNNTEVKCLGHILSGTITQIFDFELAKKIFFIILSSNDVGEIYKANSLMINFYEKFYKENTCSFEELEKVCLSEIAFLPFYYSIIIKGTEPIYSNGLYRLSIEYKKQQAWDKLVEICNIALFFNIDYERNEKLMLLANKKKIIKPYHFSELNFSSYDIKNYLFANENNKLIIDNIIKHCKEIISKQI